MSLKVLKEELADVRRDQFKEGDVIRWRAADRYSYAAIKTPVGWYTTATQNAAQFQQMVVDFDGLIKSLSRSDVSDIEFATEWTDVMSDTKTLRAVEV